MSKGDSAADLAAEVERLRDALSDIAELRGDTMGAGLQVAVAIADNALAGQSNHMRKQRDSAVARINAIRALLRQLDLALLYPTTDLAAMAAAMEAEVQKKAYIEETGGGAR